MSNSELVKKRERVNPLDREIPADWTEQRILGEGIKDLQKFVEVLRNTYGEAQFVTWVRPALESPRSSDPEDMNADICSLFANYL